MTFEKFSGKYITDNDISMPQMEEYLYNALYPMIDLDKLSEKYFYYTEDPLDGENAIGFHHNDSVFTIHVPSSSFLVGKYEVNTGKIDGNTISFKISGCRVDSVTQVSESGTAAGGQEQYNSNVVYSDLNTVNARYLTQLSGIDGKKNYLYGKVENGKLVDVNNYINEKANILQQVTTSLMFVNAPHVVYSSIELIKDSEITEITYGRLSKQGSRYSYSDKKPIFEGGDGETSYSDSSTIFFDSNDRRQVWKLNECQLDGYKGYSYYYKYNKLGYNSSNNYNGIDVVTKLGFQLQDEIVKLIKNSSDARVSIATNILNNQSTSYMTSYQTRYQNPDASEKFASEFATFYNKLFDDNTHAYTGLNLYGQDTYGRTIAVVHLKVDPKVANSNDAGGERWINLNKYIISRLVENNISSNTQMMQTNTANAVFKPETYDLYNTKYQDNFWTQLSTKYAQNERRIKLQKEILGKVAHPVCSDYDDLYEWTVSIGDVSFFVPPTSIRTISQTGTERLPLLRTKGSMARNIEKFVEQIEMDLFFNNEEGINGFEYKTDLWEDPVNNRTSSGQRKSESNQNEYYNQYDTTKNTETVKLTNSILSDELETYKDGIATYYMNGLRALYSEFRFAPFLPIINKYINETLGIAAVSLQQISVSSVPGFPRLLKATLVLRKFDYNIYMPEVPKPFYKRDSNGKETDVYVNPFALCINYDVLRYYIQKPLIRGNFIRNKLENRKASGYNVNTVEYAKDTIYYGRSAFLPYKAENYSAYDSSIKGIKENPYSTIDIYMPNEDHLKKLQKIKRQAVQKLMSGYTDNYTPTDQQERAIVDWADIYKTITLVKNDTTVSESDRIAETVRRLLSLTDKDGNYILKSISIDGNVEIDIDTVSVIFKMNSEIAAGNKSRQLILSLNEQFLSSMSEDMKTAAEECFKKKTAYDDSSKSQYASYILKDKTISLGIEGNNITALTEEQKANMEFLNWCYEDGLKIVDANLEAKELKDAIDWDGVHSLVYDLLKKDIRVDSWHVSAENHFAEVSLLGNDSTAMQYTGGSDVYIDFQITTQDEKVANIMKTVPQLEVYFMKYYHDSLPSFPIKLDSEFTRLFGIYEVSIEETTVETVPNYPGLYKISVRAISTDRSLRNKESLRALNNTDTSTADGQSGESNSITLTNKNQKTEVSFKTYDDLMNQIAVAEVYPDLELPTIGELRKLGFAYLRYKDKERDYNDLFCDPDFYFAYPAITTAEIIRRTIQTLYTDKGKNFKDTQFKYSDLSGAQAMVGPDGVDTTMVNNQYELDRRKIINDAAQELNANKKGKDSEFLKNLPLVFGGDVGKWDISTKIMANFMEKSYYELLKMAEKPDQMGDSVSVELKDNISKIKTTAEYINNLDKSRKEDGTQKLLKYLKENSVAKTNFSTSFASNPKNIASGGNIGLGFDTKSAPNYGDVVSALTNMHIASLYDKQFVLSFKDMLIAAWVAWTADDEYQGDKSSKIWYGKGKVYGAFRDIDNNLVIADDTVKEARKNLSEALTTEDGLTVSNLFTSGLFNIQKYTFNEIKEFLNEEETKELLDNHDESFAGEGNVQIRYYVLDPYYRYLGNDAINEYLKNCTEDFNFACGAFIRIMLWWLIQLYDNRIFPSMSFDVFRGETNSDISAKKKAQDLVEREFGVTVSSNSDFNNSVKEFIEKNSVAIDSGKIFTAFVLALLGKPFSQSDIYSAIAGRNYDFLNNKIKEVSSVNFKSKGNGNTDDNILRKFLLALCGMEEINAPEYIGRSNGATPFSMQISKNNNKMAIAACNDPEQYIFHSFYDMIRHDYRGRMLRAFPTFYCIFMDEGRTVGMWKLHDNFYSVNAIYDITIAKSRKIASDTCTITLSNNYQTFTTDDEDGYINYKGSFWGDIFEELLYKRKYAYKLEKQRLAANRVNRAKLQPGIRIHVRIGYGSDARELPCAFNGVIAEVQPGNKAVNVVAQGFGIELMNQILENDDGDEIRYKDCPGIFPAYSSGAKPKQILESFLTTRGGSLNRYLNGKYSSDQAFWQSGASANDGNQAGISAAIASGEEWIKNAFNANPYNIYNFGDVNYTQIFDNGEIVQNLYPVTDVPLADLEDKDIELKSHKGYADTPDISFRAQGKTMWDVAHICKSVAPEFIVGIDNFRFRNTLFFGKPHYYEAYDYTTANGVVIERRKPYSQYHFLYDNTDIIANNITASAKAIRTVAKGIYQHTMGQTTSNKNTGMLFVDKDIFPEYQKSMLVDTRLNFKSGALRKNASDKRSDGKNTNSSLISSIIRGNSIFGKSIYTDAVDNTINGALTAIDAGVDAIFGVADTAIDYIDEKVTGNAIWNKTQKQVAWLATADALKTSIKEMYQGSIVIIGTPSIKPHDRLIINDTYNNMSGQCLVRNAVHTLSPVTGLTSTIDVDCISEVDSRTEFYKSCTVTDIFYKIANFTKYALKNKCSINIDKNTNANKIIYKDIGKEIDENIAEYLKEYGFVISDEDKTELLKINETYATAKKKAAELEKSFSKIIKTGSSSAIKTAKEELSAARTAQDNALKEYNTTIDSLRTKLQNVISPVTFKQIGTALLNGMFSVTGVTSSLLSKLFYWPIKNQQVLIIFPMYKNGMTYTAGLEGNIGSVYGSPTFNDNGVIEKLTAEYLAPNSEKWFGLYQLFQKLFISDDVQNEAAKFNRNFHVYNSFSDGRNVLSNQVMTSSIVESSSYSLKDNSAFHVPSNTTGLSLFNRAVNEETDEYARIQASLALTPYYINNIEKIIKYDNRRAHLPIVEYTPLKRYMTRNNTFLEIAHNWLNPRVNTDCVSIMIDRGNHQLEIKGKVLVEPLYENSSSKNDNLYATAVGIGKESDINITSCNGLTYSTSAYVSINKNIPTFTQAEITEAANSFKRLASLDNIGRAGTCVMSTNTVYSRLARTELSSVKMNGLVQKTYSFITNGYLYNRCHLLGHALSGIKGTETNNNIGLRNLVVGTQFLNYWMNDVEQIVQAYISQTGNHVLYKAIPHFTGNNLICDGVQLMAYSIEDNGKLYFNRYYFNVQPGVNIDYATGESSTNSSAGIMNSITNQQNDIGNAISSNKQVGKKEVYDLPILHKDALIVLKDICDYAYNKLYMTNQLDQLQIKEDLKTTKIILTSALRINSNYKDIGAGFVFCMQGKGKLDNGKLFEIVQEFYNKEFNEINKVRQLESGKNLYYESSPDEIGNLEKAKAKGLSLPCFEVTKLNGNNNEIRIKIKPLLYTSLSQSTKAK